MNAPFLCYSRKGLETILPHRGAALNKIDGVLHVSGGPDAITGLKVVRDDDPDLEGHFPGVPTYPGYAQDEFVCLVAAALIPIICVGLPNDPHVVQKIVRYKKSVAPGDTLIAQVTLREKRGKFFIFSAEIRNQRNEVVAEYERIVGAVPVDRRISTAAQAHSGRGPLPAPRQDDQLDIRTLQQAYEKK